MGPNLNIHSPFTSEPMFNIQFEKIDHGIGTANRYEVKLSSLANPEAPRDNWMTTPSVGGNDQLNGGSGDDWLFGANLTTASLEGLGPGHFAQWSDDCYLFVRGDGKTWLPMAVDKIVWCWKMFGQSNSGLASRVMTWM